MYREQSHYDKNDRNFSQRRRPNLESTNTKTLAITIRVNRFSDKARHSALSVCTEPDGNRNRLTNSYRHEQMGKAKSSGNNQELIAIESPAWASRFLNEW